MPPNKRSSRADGRAKKRSLSDRAGLKIPAGRVRRFMKEGQYGRKVRKDTAVALAAALEYLAAELLDVGGAETLADKRKKITPRDLKAAVLADQDLNRTLGSLLVREGIPAHTSPHQIPIPPPPPATTDLGL